MRDYGGRISFRPCLPVDWRALRFSLVIRGARRYVEVLQDETRYRLAEGDSLPIHHAGEEIRLTASSPVASRRTPPLPVEEPASDFEPSEAPTQPRAAAPAAGDGLTPRQP